MLEWILLIIATEATTNLICKADIFLAPRRWLFHHRKHRIINFLHDLVDCPYCTSVWVAMLLFCLMSLVHHFSIVLSVLVIHRLSNLLHHIIDRINPNRIDLEKVFDKEEKV